MPDPIVILHLVKQVHVEYAAAGADVLTTNSYAWVPCHIIDEQFRDRGEELSALAGRAGSLTPMFGSYEPALFDPTAVQKQLVVLVRGPTPYIDLWLGETLSLIAEAQAVSVAVKDSGKPVWIAFTLEDGDPQSPAMLRSGEFVVEAARWAFGAGLKSSKVKQEWESRLRSLV